MNEVAAASNRMKIGTCAAANVKPIKIEKRPRRVVNIRWSKKRALERGVARESKKVIGPPRKAEKTTTTATIAKLFIVALHQS